MKFSQSWKGIRKGVVLALATGLFFVVSAFAIAQTAAAPAAAPAAAAPAAAPAPAISAGDTAWVLASAALVLLMTPGLAFFYAGMPVDTAQQSMRLLSEKVLPELKALGTGTDPAPSQNATPRFFSGR